LFHRPTLRRHRRRRRRQHVTPMAHAQQNVDDETASPMTCCYAIDEFSTTTTTMIERQKLCHIVVAHSMMLTNALNVACDVHADLSNLTAQNAHAHIQ
jgi:hypothetical protein